MWTFRMPFIVFFFSLLPSMTWATVIHVPDDEPTIQGGIDAATNGDTVMVRPGTYHEYEIDFLGKAITVTSTDPGNPAVVDSTVVDADSMGRVFNFHSGEGSTSVLTGFTITGGFAVLGGGIRCDHASPKIRRNVISGNTATESGGGLFCKNSLSGDISDNEIERNTGRKGGGIACEDGGSDITRNMIRGNTAEDSGGGIHLAWSDHTKISNNIVINNAAGGSGGGIYYDLDPSLTGEIRNCVFSDNTAINGGGLGSSYSNVEIWNTIFWSDYAESLGKEIYINCAEWEPAGIYVHSVDIEGGNQSVYRGTWCDFAGYRFDADPLFVDPEKGAYQLGADSPCIDEGQYNIDDSCRPPGLGDSRSDVGAYGGADNCGWLENSIDLLLYSGDSVRVSPGDTVIFDTIVWNATERVLDGDFWISVILPDLIEILVPEDFLDHPNPFTGQMSAHGSIDFPSELFVPAGTTGGSFTLVGRIGIHPDVVDEESFRIRVVEGSPEQSSR